MCICLGQSTFIPLILISDWFNICSRLFIFNSIINDSIKISSDVLISLHFVLLVSAMISSKLSLSISCFYFNLWLYLKATRISKFLFFPDPCQKQVKHLKLRYLAVSRMFFDKEAKETELTPVSCRWPRQYVMLMPLMAAGVTGPPVTLCEHLRQCWENKETRSLLFVKCHTLRLQKGKWKMYSPLQKCFPVIVVFSMHSLSLFLWKNWCTLLN